MSMKFTSDHEWVETQNLHEAVVGITLHAQDALGDVVFVELPAVGKTFKKGDVAGVVESVKAAADLYMPVTGTVVAVNNALNDNPSLANTDPQGEGWFFKIKIDQEAELNELLDAERYQELLASI